MQALREQLMAVVVDMASRGLRCICLAQADIPAIDKSRPADFFEVADNVDKGMTAVAIVGIKDPVRPEVGGGACGRECGWWERRWARSFRGLLLWAGC